MCMLTQRHCLGYDEVMGVPINTVVANTAVMSLAGAAGSLG